MPTRILQPDPVANTDHELEHTTDEGYDSYSLAPAGTFTMGDTYDEGNPREKPVHRVYLEAYYIGKFEITNREYSRFMVDRGCENQDYWSNGGFRRSVKPLHWHDAAYNGGGIAGNEDFPVVGMSWLEAASYCSWLSAKTGSIY